MTEAPGPRYQPFYCEENVYWLCREPRLGAEPHAVFVSNGARAVALYQQCIAPPGEPCVWDYHVFAISRAAEEAFLAWDLDSRLPFPVPLRRYLAETFLPVAPRHAPHFRVVDAARLAATFGTDRSHMRDANGAFSRPPPPWPPPGFADGGPGESTVMRFIDTRAAFEGEVFDLDGLVRRFGR